MTDTKTKSIWVALANAQNAFPKITKNKQGHHYQYADLAQIKELTDEVLAKHDLVLVDRCDASDDGLVLTTTLRHLPSDSFLNSEWKLLETKDPQARGSELTYARRYNRLCLLGLTPEDDDGAAASRSKPVYKPRGLNEQRVKPVSDTSGPGDVNWVIPFGKYKGRQIDSLTSADLVSYRDFLSEKGAKGNAAKFVKLADQILGGPDELGGTVHPEPVLPEPPPSHQEDIPF